jgi:hypothetical protein
MNGAKSRSQIKPRSLLDLRQLTVTLTHPCQCQPGGPLLAGGRIKKVWWSDF